jgi:hypothetical protein
VLQPAEETGKGALAILETGVLDGVKAIFGGHVDRRFAVGQVVADEGPLAAGDTRTLMLAARAAKEHLSTHDSSRIQAVLTSGAKVDVTLPRDTFTAITETLVAKTLSSVRKALRDAKLAPADIDGIVMVGKNEFIISNYQGILYYVKADGTKQLLLDTRANRIMSNDISYNSKTKTLYVPSFGTNRVIAYKVK